MVINDTDIITVSRRELRQIVFETSIAYGLSLAVGSLQSAEWERLGTLDTMIEQWIRRNAI